LFRPLRLDRLRRRRGASLATAALLTARLTMPGTDADLVRAFPVGPGRRADGAPGRSLEIVILAALERPEKPEQTDESKAEQRAARE